MSIINSQPLIGSSGQGGAYNLTNSLRFRASASAYLNRTPASASNQKTWTWSGWVKRGSINASFQRLFSSKDSSNDDADCLRFNSGETFSFLFRTTPNLSFTGNLTTTQVFRDPSAWYHIVAVLDTTQATSSNRMKLYVNGTQITSFSTATYPTQNDNGYVNSTNLHTIGNNAASLAQNFDGYLAEVNFIDGQALTPSSFGETSTTTGVWIPKKYTGTYGTNGFYLPFTNTASTSTLGNDFSGNSNTWTVNNISLTAGSTYDSMTDVPTLTSATAANYCVMNPLRIQNVNIAAGTLSDGNLKITTSASDNAYSNHYGTMAFPTTGKWYFEAVFAGAFGNDAGNYAGITGVSNGNAACTIVVTSTTAIQKNFSNVQTGLSFAVGDILGVAFDATNLTVDFYKNGSAFGSQVTGLDSVEYTPFILAANPANTQSSWTLNFGQRPFTYTPPTGFVALNTFNLPTPTIGATASTTANKYMNVNLWTGDGSSSRNITGIGFAPDFVWIKNRANGTRFHVLNDTVRGANKQLFSNNTNAEETDTTQLTAFGSDGFTIGNNANVNENTSGIVSWNWRASNATAVTNTAGSITSTVSANTTAGFSIVTYTGNGTNNATVGHGLGVTPDMLITKTRNQSRNWYVWHKNLSGANYGLGLNDSQGEAAFSFGTWGTKNSTIITAVQGINGITNVNASSDTYVVYAFAQVAGYSAFGSYTGNGSSDGTFVFTGFRPRYVMVKRTDSTGNWFIWDSARETFNVMGDYLLANASDAEPSGETILDFVSNGFKMRALSAGVNASGGTYIYMAFCESPFKYSNAR
jgi:hypothetical protein